LTTCGLEKKEFKEIAEIIHDTLQNPFTLKLKKANKNKTMTLIKKLFWS